MADDANGTVSGSESTVLPPLPPRVQPDSYMQENEHKDNKGNLKTTIVFKFRGSGGKINVAALHKQIFSHMQDADEDVEFIVDATDDSIVVSLPEDFPTNNDDYKGSFTVSQPTEDIVTVSHNMYSSQTVETMKQKHAPLLSYLKTHEVRLNTSFSGSIDERPIGVFFGIHPDRVSRKMFTHDFTNAVAQMELTHDETELFEKASAALPFSGNTPPFQIRPAPVFRKANGKDFSAKVLHFCCATEHSKFWRTFLVRTKSDQLIHGLGHFYSFSRKDSPTLLLNAIVWHNKSIDDVVVLPILGISLAAMDLDIKVTYGTTSQDTTIRRVLMDSGHFKSIHSTAETAAEGKWNVTTSKDTVSAAKTFINEHIIRIFNSSAIQASDLIATTPVPRIGEKRDSDRKINQDRQHRSWSSIVADDASVLTAQSEYTQSKQIRPKSTKRVEFIYDADIIHEFPPLPKMDSVPPHQQDAHSANSNDSPTSSVTRDELQQLRDDFKQECATIVSSISGLSNSNSAHSTLREELQQERAEHAAAMERQMQAQLDAFSRQMQDFQATIIATMLQLHDRPPPSQTTASSAATTTLAFPTTPTKAPPSQAPRPIDPDPDENKRSHERSDQSPAHKLAKAFKGQQPRKAAHNASRLFREQLESVEAQLAATEVDENMSESSESEPQSMPTYSQVASPPRVGGRG